MAATTDAVALTNTTVTNTNEETTMEKRRLTAPSAANSNVPLLTIERAIADGLSPTSLRQVAEANRKSAAGKNGAGRDARLDRQADNLLAISEKLELLAGYRRAA